MHVNSIIIYKYEIKLAQGKKRFLQKENKN